MKKKLKLFMFCTTLAAVALNVSVDSSGNIALLSSVKASSGKLLEDSAQKWKAVEVGCYDKSGKNTSTAIYCFAGENKDCSPDDPCPAYEESL